MVARLARMTEAILPDAATNPPQALRQATAAAAAASANTGFARRLLLGYWNTVSIGSGSGL